MAEIARSLADVAQAPSVVGIGFFDGVHRGHQSIIRRAVRFAEESGTRSVVVTFDRHPMEVVNPGSQPKLLMTLARRARVLGEQGVDLVVVLPFDDDLRHASAEDFVDHVLCGPLQAQRVVVGANFRFGHKAAGDVAVLADLGPSRGFASEGVTLLELDGTVISSTEIRAAVDRGDVERATRMLGRPHVVDGVVVRGDQRGAELGYPTANLQVDPRIAVPAPGIYAGVAALPGDRQAAAAISVGTNPTFGGAELRIEAFLLDFDEDVYGVRCALDFRHRLRGQERYENIADLAAQIGRDVVQTRALLR